MDNLTHTLLGLLAGEVVARHARPRAGGLPPGTRRTACLALGMVGGNLPDADLLVSYGDGPGGLGYLLQHRGHTHTLLGCVLLGAALGALALLWLRRRHGPLAPGDRWLVPGFALLAVLLHLGLDALNSYGVHPFWPWNDRWYYGDAVFIVEPLYWLALAPLVFQLHTRVGRLALGAAVLLGLVLQLVAHPRAPLWWLLAASVATGLALLGRRMTPAAAARLGVAGVVAITLSFVATGRLAQARATELARTGFPAARLADPVLTPSPSNPGCWDLVLVQTEGDALVLRHGLLSLGEGGRQCRPLLPVRGAAPLRPVVGGDDPRITWFGEVATPLARLRELAREQCDAFNLLQFARAPFAAPAGDGTLLGDLRFDRSEGEGMAKLRLPDVPRSGCRHRLPWVPPRAGELGLGEAQPATAVRP